MSSYIVRVYRREKQKNQPDRLYGVVEAAEDGEVSVFRSLDDLWTILSSAESIQQDILDVKKWENEKERRQDPRFSYGCPIRYHTREDAPDLSLSDESEGTLYDISRGGMRMQTKAPQMKAGDVLKMQVPMSGAPVTFPSLTKVRWIQKAQTGNCQVGLQFIA